MKVKRKEEECKLRPPQELVCLHTPDELNSFKLNLLEIVQHKERIRVIEM